ncbi:MAG: hypothetical protein KC418_00515 [Anaerolineales bacterium]|nr:hypothetical protein [Anaerolineales bacterium]MCB8954405.1 hypothetical protein [Ardenticatenales bacterium]
MFSKRVSLLLILFIMVLAAAVTSRHVRADAATTAVAAGDLRGADAAFGTMPNGGLIWDYGPTTGNQAGCWSNYTAGQNFAEDVSFPTNTTINTIVIFTCIAPQQGQTLHIKVRNDDHAGNPSNTLLYDADVAPTSWVADPVTGGYAVTADLPGGFEAFANAIYWIGLSGNGFELGQYSVQTPDDGHMAQFAGPNFSFHTAVGDQMFQLYGSAGCAPIDTQVTINPNLSLTVSTGNTNKVWLVRFYFANGTSNTVLQTGLPGCFNQTFNTQYVPTNPPITSICSFLYDPTVPGIVAQHCAPVP